MTRERLAPHLGRLPNAREASIAMQIRSALGSIGLAVGVIAAIASCGPTPNTTDGATDAHTDATPSDGGSLDATDAVTTVDATDATDAGMPDVTVDTGYDAYVGTCASAIVVSDGTVRMGDDLSDGSPAMGACGANAAPIARFYRVTLEAGASLSVTATPKGAAWQAEVRIQHACGDAMCLATGDSPAPRETAGASYLNTDTTASDFVIVVSGTDAANRGLFDLAVTIHRPVPYTACAQAMMVTDGTRLAMEDLATANAPSSACLAGAHGGQLFYSATIPPGQTLLAAAATNPGDTPWTPVIRVYDNCTATTCLTNSGATPHNPAEVRFSNSGTSPRTVILGVASTSATEIGTFTLSIAIHPPSSNVTCAMARALGATTHLIGEDLGAATTSLASVCQPTAVGGALFYSATIPAGQTLSITATPSAPGFSAVIRVLAACGATSCLASTDPGATPSAAVNYVNSTSMSQDVIFAVGNHASGGGVFDLDVTIATAPYTETLIPSACDDMTGGMAHATAIGDDSATALIALPFTFVLMGEMADHYSLTSNGFAQFYLGATGTPSTAYTSHAIPTAAPGDPRGFVAPFWDDLVNQTGTGLTTKQFPAPSPRFTIEWTNWALYRIPSTLTFQVKLFQTTNVIELHYCTLTPGTTSRVFGDHAAIGVENRAGTAGWMHSFHSPNAVDTVHAIRLTPAM